MNSLKDKILLLIYGFIFISGIQFGVLPIFSFLIAIVVSSMNSIFQNKKAIGFCIFLFIGICLVFPIFCVFLPLLFYDIFRWKFIYHGMGGILVFFYHLNEFSSIEIGCLLCGLMISGILQKKTVEEEKYREDIIRLRDTSTELNLELKRKNKNLMEKQDYEIYTATLNERNRIAREIHDNVGHMLSRSILQLGAIGAVNKDAGIQPFLEELKNTLVFAMNSIRDSVHDLKEEALDLEVAIKSVLDGLTGYDVKFDYDMSENIPKAVKYCFIATIKEAVTNLVKHSNATFFQVVSREHPGFYQLLIWDNGSVTGSQNKPGMGLENMRERTENLHGIFRIHEEKGFQIFISIPKEEYK